MKRTYLGEMEWALNQAYVLNNDRNSNREAQVTAALKFGLDVAIARRSDEPVPERPDLSKVV